MSETSVFFTDKTELNLIQVYPQSTDVLEYEVVSAETSTQEHEESLQQKLTDSYKLPVQALSESVIEFSSPNYRVSKVQRDAVVFK